MKLIVQIPCLNEEKTLPLVVRSIPKRIKGVDKVEILVVDDGSTDRTFEIAKRLGVDHILRHRVKRGLAYSFADGIDYAIKLGADIIVNTDADNQYPQKDIPRLIEPIIARKADIVVADRQTAKIAHMRHSASAILRVYTMYNPLIIFFIIGALISLVGFAAALRFFYFFLQGKGSGHVQS